MSEEVSPFALTGKGIIDIQDEDVRDNINALLNGVTMKNSATPYTALEHVKKVLANFHIFLPRTKFLEGDSGYDVWNISQFGDKVGMDNDGQFKSSTQSPYFMFFEWQMCDNGTFKVFAEIVNQEELDELMSDVDDEFEESDDDDMEEMNEEWKIRKTGNSHTVYKDGKPVKEFTPKDHGANRGATKKAATRFVGYMKKYMGEGKDYEGDMAKSELNAIADMSKKMSSKMKDDDQLEAWVQSKITKAKDYIRAAHDNMMYDKTKDVNESELPLVGGSGPTAKEARRSSEREGRQSIYQKKQAAAKAAAEKRHPVGSSVSFDASHAHALGAGVDKHPGLKRFSKPGKTMTGTVVRHSTDIRNYKGNGIMNVGGADNPRYHPVVKLDNPVRVSGRTITHTTINHPYLKIKK